MNQIFHKYPLQEIRAVKAHRDYLNKTTHLYLFVRHQFKCGLLNELKRDLHAAYKHYGQAYRVVQLDFTLEINLFFCMIFHRPS